MTDRDEVLDALGHCARADCRDCKWECGQDVFVEVPTDLLEAALELLKAQEPIKAEDFYKPKLNEAHSYVSDAWRCGACENRIYYHQKYCGVCGKAVKWDD